VIIVKVGGSLYNTPELAHWLSALAAYSLQQPIVIVPGGGPFADQVRVAQQYHHFNDETAHHMAIIAMKQFGLLLSSLAPSSQIINGNALPTSAFSIWLPDDELLTEPLLLKSWDSSADSIALLLADQLQAEQLLLIKHSSTHSTSIKELTADKIIDNGFAQLFSTLSIITKIIDYKAYTELSDTLSKSNNHLNLQLS